MGPARLSCKRKVSKQASEQAEWWRPIKQVALLGFPISGGPLQGVGPGRCPLMPSPFIVGSHYFTDLARKTFFGSKNYLDINCQVPLFIIKCIPSWLLLQACQVVPKSPLLIFCHGFAGLGSIHRFSWQVYLVAFLDNSFKGISFLKKNFSCFSA